MRTLGGLALLLSLSLPNVSCDSARETVTGVTIAATLPLSSAEAELASAWKRGYERAVAEVNRAGGLMVKSATRRVQVTLLIRDDRGDVAMAEQVAEDLIASGANALLATPGLIKMAVQAAVAQRHSRPYVVPSTAGMELTASERPWVLVSPAPGASEEDEAYAVARAALTAFSNALTLDPEAIRRAFTTPQGD